MTMFPGYALAAELVALREQIRRIVRDELLPIEQRIGPDAPEIPEEDYRRPAAKPKAAGLWCLGAPEQYGGGGLVPFPLLQKLVEIIGSAGTRELLFIGKPVTALRALEMGMVHQVVSAAEIESTTLALARTIAGHAPLSLTGIKAGLLRAVSLREQVDHRDLDELARRAHQSADAAEGRQAMLEKRPPVFRGK